MQTDIIFTRWELEPDVHGEAAMMMYGEAAYDMAVTPSKNGGVLAELLDGRRTLWECWFPTVESAKRAVETAAERRL